MSVRAHTAYNLAGGLLPVMLSLLTIPAYIGLIGEARYGVLAIAWLLLGYFGLFDLGLGAATAQHIAALPPHDGEQRAQVFWTALAMNAALGAVGGLLLYPAAHLYFAHGAQVDVGLGPEIKSALPWLMLALPLATVSGVLTGALQGRFQFLSLNATSIAGAALTQLLPLAVAALHGPALAWLVAAVVASRLVVLLVLMGLCVTHVTGGAAPRFVAERATSLLRFGGWVTVTAIVGPLMVILDRFLIGGLVGPKAVAHYTVPFQLAERTTLIPTALTSALFPRMTAAGPHQSRAMAAEAVRALAVVMTPLIAIGLMLMHPFLGVWLDTVFSQRAGLPGQLLLLGFWLNSLARVPYVVLQAEGRPDTVARCHLMEVLPYLALLYAGLHLGGIAGAALAFSVRAGADCVLLMHFAGTLAASARALFMPALLLLATFAAALWAPKVFSLEWLAACAVVTIVTAAWAAWAAPRRLRGIVRDKLGLRRDAA